MWPAGFGADSTGPQYALGQIVYQHDDKVERLAIKKISGGGNASRALSTGPEYPTNISPPFSSRRIPRTRRW